MFHCVKATSDVGKRILGVDSVFHFEVYPISIVSMFPKQNSTVAMYFLLCSRFLWWSSTATIMGSW